MSWQTLIDRVHELSDLELATLLCLIAQEHCIVETDHGSLNDLEQELQLIVSSMFGLSYTVIHCTERTTVEEFENSVLASDYGKPSTMASSSNGSFSEIGSSERYGIGHQSTREKSRSPVRDTQLDERKLVNVVIARNFDLTPELIQIQAVDLLRTRRIFTRTGVHSAPKTFLFLPLLSVGGSTPRLNQHLNDHMFISHYHDPEDGFPNLQDDSGWLSDDKASLSSVKKRKSIVLTSKVLGEGRLIRQNEIDAIRQRSNDVIISTEVKTYLQNVAVFLRLNRAVARGVSSRATTHFDLLVKCLAPLHSLQYVTPSLVVLAARKIYPHRIQITTPENERSLQYGSDIRAVTALLKDASPESVIEEVLATVEPPL